MKEAIFFCMVGLPLFGKEGTVTPVFKILVRSLRGPQYMNGVLYNSYMSRMPNVCTKFYHLTRVPHVCRRAYKLKGVPNIYESRYVISNNVAF